MVHIAWCDWLLGGGFCHSQGRMAGRNGRSYFKDQLLAAVSRTTGARQAMAKGYDKSGIAAIHLEISEKFP
jgi:hypothetical protein